MKCSKLDSWIWSDKQCPDCPYDSRLVSPNQTDGIILGCPYAPWDTGWEGWWDLDHLMGQMGQSWDVLTIHGTKDGKDGGIWAP